MFSKLQDEGLVEHREHTRSYYGTAIEGGNDR